MENAVNFGLIIRVGNENTVTPEFAIPTTQPCNMKYMQHCNPVKSLVLSVNNQKNASPFLKHSDFT